VLNNYRNVLAGMFSTMWGLAPQQLEVVFPGAPPVNLRVI